MCTMPYEYPIRGVLRPLKARPQRAVDLNGRRRGQWTAPDKAVLAAVGHSTGLEEWDRTRPYVSDDLTL